MKEFPINDIEQDIIIKHMWPLTVIPPRYKESLIVCFIDKYAASLEFINGYAKAKTKIKTKVKKVKHKKLTE
jgi:uncharacterized protein